MDEEAAAVVRVRGALDKPARLEPVDERGYRPRGEPHAPSEVAWGQGTIEVQMLEGHQLRERELQVGGEVSPQREERCVITHKSLDKRYI